MTDKLREAAQNILNGIETRAIRIETKQDETWANALSQLRAALAEAQQGDGLGLKMVDGWGVFDTLENGEPFLETLGSRFFVFESRTAADDTQHRWPWGTATVRPVQVVWRECQYPDCLDGYLQEFSAEGLRVKGNPCPTCHGEKP